jgi:hypothetical protein
MKAAQFNCFLLLVIWHYISLFRLFPVYSMDFSSRESAHSESLSDTKKKRMRDAFWFVFICALRFRRILASFYTNEILALPGLCGLAASVPRLLSLTILRGRQRYRHFFFSKVANDWAIINLGKRNFISGSDAHYSRSRKVFSRSRITCKLDVMTLQSINSWVL